MNLFSLFAKISLDDSEYKTKVKQNEELTKKFAFNVSNAWAGIKTGVKTASGAAASFIGVLGKIGLDYNAQMESYTTDFEVMLGDAGKAVEKVESLKQMAAKTPFELTDLSESTKKLLAFNVANEDTNKVLGQLGDISLGNKQKLESLTLAYGKMNAAQKVTLEDINIMIDAGYNPLLQISEKTGESMSELYDRISRGEVAFSEVQGAIESATSSGGQFYQGMEKASQTTQGLTSTLKDVVSSKAGEFFSGISEKIKEALPNVISFIENINVDSVLSSLENLYNTFVNLLPAITGITAAIVTFRTAMTISVIIDTVSKAITAFKVANNAATISQAALNAVMNLNPFVLIATLIAGAVAALITLWNTNEGFRNAVIGIWEKIKEVFSSAWEGIKAVWDAVKPYFEAIWEGIKQAFSVAADFFSNIFNLAWEGIKVYWDAVTGYFQAIWDTIEGIFSVVKDVLTGDFQGAWEGIQGIVDTWKDYFQDVWDGIKNIFSNVWDFFTDIGSDIIDGIKNGISDAWEGLTSWFDGLWNGLFGGRSVNVDVNKNERSIDGSHAAGLSYVPFNGYIAELHKGERVLTAQEAKDYNSRLSQPINITVNAAPQQDERMIAQYVAAELQKIINRRRSVYA